MFNTKVSVCLTLSVRVIITLSNYYKKYSYLAYYIN
jgi:hypothetical protein